MFARVLTVAVRLGSILSLTNCFSLRKMDADADGISKKLRPSWYSERTSQARRQCARIAKAAFRISFFFEGVVSNPVASVSIR
jgi:hypothetical protein